VSKTPGVLATFSFWTRLVPCRFLFLFTVCPPSLEIWDSYVQRLHTRRSPDHAQLCSADNDRHARGDGTDHGHSISCGLPRRQDDEKGRGGAGWRRVIRAVIAVYIGFIVALGDTRSRPRRRVSVSVYRCRQQQLPPYGVCVIKVPRHVNKALDPTEFILLWLTLSKCSWWVGPFAPAARSVSVSVSRAIPNCPC